MLVKAEEQEAVYTEISDSKAWGHIILYTICWISWYMFSFKHSFVLNQLK